MQLPAACCEATTAPAPSVTAFVCVNCAPGAAGGPGRRRPAGPLTSGWPVNAREVTVPCGGRCQPEHLPKALEDGADVVCLVACEESDCHYLEGCLRARRRVEHVRRLMAEIGLEPRRLMLLSLPGTARQDMAAGAAAAAAPSAPPADPAERLEAIRGQVMANLESLPPSPLRRGASAGRGEAAEGAR